MYGFGGLGEVEVEIWSYVTIAGQTNNRQKGKIELLSQWTMEGWDEQFCKSGEFQRIRFPSFVNAAQKCKLMC